MAFENRDWMRPRSQSRIALPQWSVTTWIIAICVTVFVLDGFLGKKFLAGCLLVQPISTASHCQARKAVK